VREDTGYVLNTGRPRIRPAMRRIKYLSGPDKGRARWIRTDIADDAIARGIAVEVVEREAGEEG
jgi:hypothetical protein